MIFTPAHRSWIRIGLWPWIVAGWQPAAGGKTSASASTYCNLTLRWDESFADDLIVWGSAVSSRVALLLRSAEANLLSSRFVPFTKLFFACEQRCFGVELVRFLPSPLWAVHNLELGTCRVFDWFWAVRNFQLVPKCDCHQMVGPLQFKCPPFNRNFSVHFANLG